ncbi:TetR/AcrR family transcriptional regulator [Bacillus sp. FJAT-49711]|uniref:TetR/AcrR family transcriptional regulator n=1 Tax=Bacillus sp. FJAT-49711 TaxID=2833585 RepID=UPI001BC90A58|nr:TetR/AcrR family transcriptional regulator [Bacillus sp. FJAT-49711]MBS4220732.1 TetR/AcrR family transcriptional regulator [Bacillus sp. FJAT-49711]
MARERKFSMDDLFRETKHILLQYGYEGFTFGILASKLGISRGALYKYFDNKDVLITDYMVYETEQFIEKLKKINTIEDFEGQFDFVLHTILKDTEIHQIREMAIKMPKIEHKKIGENKKRIAALHQNMYQSMQDFINKGKNEAKLKQQLPDDLIIGFLFNTIDLPNHRNIPYSEWIQYIKEIICHGIVIEK